MAILKLRGWLLLLTGLIGVCLVGLVSVAAQTAPPLFVTNTPQAAALTPTSLSATLTRSAAATPTSTLALASAEATETALLTGTVYAQARSSVRECPRRDCALLGVLAVGAAVIVTGEQSGEIITAGNDAWYRVDYQGREGYVYSGLVANRPSAFTPQGFAPVSLPGQSGANPSFVPSGAALTCDGRDNLSCSNFANIAQAQMHLNTCGDEDQLDTDHDGFACEPSQS
ncbi:MAG: SH3 domain-containing protein [Chloroflexota bacterium]